MAVSPRNAATARPDEASLLGMLRSAACTGLQNPNQQTAEKPHGSPTQHAVFGNGRQLFGHERLVLLFRQVTGDGSLNDHSGVLCNSAGNELLNAHPCAILKPDHQTVRECYSNTCRLPFGRCMSRMNTGGCLVTTLSTTPGMPQTHRRPIGATPSRSARALHSLHHHSPPKMTRADQLDGAFASTETAAGPTTRGGGVA